MPSSEEGPRAGAQPANGRSCTEEDYNTSTLTGLRDSKLARRDRVTCCVLRVDRVLDTQHATAAGISYVNPSRQGYCQIHLYQVDSALSCHQTRREPMAIQPAPSPFSALPQRQYARAGGGAHVSLGGPIRRIIWVVLVVIWALISLRLYGLPTRTSITGAVAFIAGLLVISIFTPGIRVAAQWEKGVVLRLGRFAGLRGPGVFYVFPGLESALFVDTRLLTLDIPGQKAITKDNVPVQID